MYGSELFNGRKKKKESSLSSGGYELPYCIANKGLPESEMFVIFYAVTQTFIIIKN
jgi:hypothetical protein